MFHWPSTSPMPECFTVYGKQVNHLVFIPGNQFVWFYMASIQCTGLFLFRMSDYASWLCCDMEFFLSFKGSTLSVCLQDGSNCRQRSLLCLWACLFRNSFNRTESTHHGPKLYTWKERGFVSEEHSKVSNVMVTEFPNNNIYWFQPLLHDSSSYMNHET